MQPLFVMGREFLLCKLTILNEFFIYFCQIAACMDDQITQSDFQI